MGIEESQASIPLVSVITPCYNDGAYLMECVASVAASTYGNVEHIVINDGSTDSSTLEVLKTIEAAGKVRVIHTANQGVCKARNEAIRASNGKYILPVDGDDKIGREYIALAVEVMQIDENVKIVAADYQLFGQVNRVQVLEPFSMEKLLGHNWFHNCSMYRREDFDRLGGYNAAMDKGLEDWDFWIGIMENGGDVKYLSGVQSYYRIKPTAKSRNANIDAQKHVELRHQIWENHKELFGRVFFDPIQSFEYMRVAGSKEYRLGRILLAPIRKLMGK